jgi:hypothetical protein
MSSPILTIDVAHPPRHADEVEREIVSAVARIASSPSLRLLKIVHGYGSSGKGGATREVVRGWAFRHRQKYRAIIEGGRYSLFEPTVQELRKEIGNFPDPDLEAQNEGILVLWIK